MDGTVRPLHAPYATGLRPFSIALAPLEPHEWLEVDDRRTADLRQKAVILEGEREAFRAEPGTEPAQAEVERLVRAHLAERGIAVPVVPDGAPPLMRAALLVQDDLVIMRRGEQGWRLAAAALAFPSSWLLSEKFARPMDTIHENVPGWAGAMSRRVSRIFDNLAADALVWRLNWSIQFDDRLPMPRSKNATSLPTSEPAEARVRVERQTLRRLARGDLLFTIKVMVDPVAAFARHPDGASLAARLADELEGLSAPQLAYKGLGDVRADLVAGLRRLAVAAPDDWPEPGGGARLAP